MTDQAESGDPEDASRVAIDEELSKLADAFDAVIQALPRSLRDASKRIEERIGLRIAESGNWAGRLSPLTVMYPALQAEGFSTIDRDAARTATLAQLCILIFAFVDDRRVDGQLDADASEVAFADAMLAKGLDLLSNLPGYGPEAQRAVDDLLAIYASAQSATYAPSDRGIEAPVTQSRIRAVASGRAAHGAVSVMALAASAGVPPRAQRRMRNAFDALVVALQWSDDLSDWKEDLQRGEDNLLLYALRARCPEPSVSGDGPSGVGATAEALLRYGVFDLAADQAGRWYAAAAERQRALGCTALAKLIEETASKLGPVRERKTQRALADAIAWRLQRLGAGGRHRG